MKTALITGAGAPGGIGFATARALAADGHRLIIAATSGRIHARAAELAAELAAEGREVLAFQGDLTDAATVGRLADLAGPVDILVNNAGLASLGEPVLARPFLDLTLQDWRRQIDMNLTSAVLMTQAFLPGMLARGWGRVVMMASVTGPVVAFPGASAYATAKAGMMGLVRSLALEVGAQGVTVNGVGPGWIATEQLSPVEAEAARATPLRRAGRPEEVAACVRFLASGAASYVNGSLLVVDGGNCLQEMKQP